MRSQLSLPSIPGSFGYTVFLTIMQTKYNIFITSFSGYPVISCNIAVFETLASLVILLALRPFAKPPVAMAEIQAKGAEKKGFEAKEKRDNNSVL